ncbi:MAG: hypothetical protein FWB78_02410 [Treponema sp.]|nr:hypothetical protein [Treponema sp.]
MKNRITAALALLLALPVAAFATDVATVGGARFDIVSRTSFGIDLDNPYRFGLSNELTQFDLVFGLAPWQELSNRPTTTQPVGFIQLTLFHLNLLWSNPDRHAPSTPPTPPPQPGGSDGPGYNPPGPVWANRFQTGSFIAGIAWGSSVLQLNAGGNEPFFAPWNRGMEFFNDRFIVSWAYVDSMVDVRRVHSITGIPVITRRGEENLHGDGQTGVHQSFHLFDFHYHAHIGDRFAMDLGPEVQMVALMHNAETFGLNFKLGTQFPFWDSRISSDNMNGLAFGLDSMFNPSFLPGLRAFASVAGTTNWGYIPAQRFDVLYGGTRIGYTIQLHEEISVEPWAGFDIGSHISRDGNITLAGYEFSIGATMRWPGQGGWLTDYFLNSDGRVFPGMSFGYIIYDDRGARNSGLVHSLRFTLHEPRGDAGIFYGLGSQIVIDIVDITGATTIPHPVGGVPIPGGLGGFCVLVTAYFDWEFTNVGRIPGTLRPWTILFYDNIPHPDPAQNGRINDLKFDIGLNIENAIPNTTFGIVWNTGSLLQYNLRDPVHLIRPTDNPGRMGFLRLIAEIRL